MSGAKAFRLIGWVLAMGAALALAACADSPKRPGRVSARPAGPMPSSPAYRQCTADLSRAQVRFQPVPVEQRAGGCTIIDAVKLLDIGVPTTGLGPLACPLAGSFAAWARYAVVPAARLYLGSEVVRIETFGTYSCRTVRGNGKTGKLSEHAHANAVDVSAFVLADGRKISLVQNWSDGGPGSRFLRRVRESACKRFRTVLSPDYNAAHHDHFHFDNGGKGGYCR